MSANASAFSLCVSVEVSPSDNVLILVSLRGSGICLAIFQILTLPSLASVETEQLAVYVVLSV